MRMVRRRSIFGQHVPISPLIDGYRADPIHHRFERSKLDSHRLDCPRFGVALQTD